MFGKFIALVGLELLAASDVAHAQPAAEIEAVTIHPPVASYYMRGEHHEGQLPYPGDDLGADCVVMGGAGITSADDGFLSAFKRDGGRNEDWHGWRQPVLAPFDGTVAEVIVNPRTNMPGQAGEPPASMVIFERADGVQVLFAHLQGISVKAGDAVRSGQPFAEIGNNGFGRYPHLHLGAYRGKTPLQVRFDLRLMGALRRR